jgi:hypothetical protein
MHPYDKGFPRVPSNPIRPGGVRSLEVFDQSVANCPIDHPPLVPTPCVGDLLRDQIGATGHQQNYSARVSEIGRTLYDGCISSAY